MISKAIRSVGRGNENTEAINRPALNRSRSQLNISNPMPADLRYDVGCRPRSNSQASPVYPPLPSPQSPVPAVPERYTSKAPSPPLTPQHRKITPTGSDVAELTNDENELSAPYDDSADEPPSPSNDPRQLPEALYAPLMTRAVRSRPPIPRATASQDSIVTQGSHRTFPARALVSQSGRPRPQISNMRVHVEPVAGQPNQHAVEMRFVLTLPTNDSVQVTHQI